MTITNQTDQKELLQHLRDGKVWAFEQLYRQYAKPLLWKLRRMVKEAEEADEILQDLFVKIWEKREQILIQESFEAYIYRMAQRMAVDYFRKIQRQSKLYDQVQINSTEIVDNLEELLVAKETQTLLDQAISGLPEQRRRAFMLCKIEGKSHREAAELMNISPNTVHNHLVKAVATIKVSLEKSERALFPLVILLAVTS